MEEITKPTVDQIISPSGIDKHITASRLNKTHNNVWLITVVVGIVFTAVLFALGGYYFIKSNGNISNFENRVTTGNDTDQNTESTNSEPQDRENLQ